MYEATLMVALSCILSSIESVSERVREKVRISKKTTLQGCKLQIVVKSKAKVGWATAKDSQ